MAKVLVTGGDGHLGRFITPRLIKAGHSVRVMSRKAAPPDRNDVTWATANLNTGQGVEQAVSGIDVIIHSASGGLSAKVEDGDGTKQLLDAAKAAGVGLVTYISIVGIDRMPLGTFGYYRAKLAAERMIEQSGIPYTILRATQFHRFVEQVFIETLTKLPIAVLPGDFKFQTVDTSEVADALVAHGVHRAEGLLPDIAGPEVMTLRQMAELYFAAKGIRRLVLPMPTFGGFAAGLKLGQNTSPDHAVGKITWAEWLARKYGKKVATQESMVSA